VDFHFNPQSGWDGNQFSYTIPPKQTDDRTLFINPYENLGFLEVGLFPNEMDPVVMDSTDVHIAHVRLDGTEDPEKVITVRPDSPEQKWRFRSDEAGALSYRYRLVHHLKDGTTRESEPVITRATQLPVNDPFDDALTIDFIPLFDPAAVRQVFIDVEYDDDANGYRRRERITVTPEEQGPIQLRLALMNPAVRNFRYRLAFIGTNNSMDQTAFEDTSDTLIRVAPRA
jgi:hypothetical protein